MHDAAGIAHELNNPAAAIQGVAEELTRRIKSNDEHTRQLLNADLTPEHVETVHALMNEKEASRGQKPKLSGQQQMESEDGQSGWLSHNGSTDRRAAETFAESGITFADLAELKTSLGIERLRHLMPWLENLVSSQKIIHDMSEAASRISDLVASIKSHVHMDRTKDLQSTDLHQDIGNTLTLLGKPFQASWKLNREPYMP